MGTNFPFDSDTIKKKKTTIWKFYLSDFETVQYWKPFQVIHNHWQHLAIFGDAKNEGRFGNPEKNHLERIFLPAWLASKQLEIRRDFPAPIIISPYVYKVGPYQLYMEL